MKTIDRVKEIMIENGLNIRDDVLVINCQIIYITAQRDYIADNLRGENENKRD